MKNQTRVSQVRPGRCRGDSGAALVEAAFTLPIILTFILGAFDLAFTELRYGTINSAARDGARVAILGAPKTVAFSDASCTTVDSRMNNICKAVVARTAGTTPSMVRVRCYNGGLSTSPIGPCGLAKSNWTVEIAIEWTSRPLSFVGKTFVGTRAMTTKSRMVIP